MEDQVGKSTYSEIAGMDHDYSKDSHYNYLLNSLGGYTLLKEKFPLVLECLEKTRSQHQQRNQQKQLQNFDNQQNLFGSIEGIQYDMAGKVSSNLTMSLPEKYAKLMLQAKLYDLQTNVLLNTISKSVDSQQCIDSKISYESQDLAKAQNANFKVVCDFMYLKSDGTMVSATRSLQEMKKYNGVATVQKVEVEDPRHIKTGTNGNIVVYYNRESSMGEYFDYSYPTGPKGQFPNETVRIFLPVNGSATLSPDLIVDSLIVSESSSYARLNINGTTISHMKITEDYISYSANKVMWDFVDDWGRDFFIADIYGKQICQFDLNLQFRVHAKNDPAQIFTASVNVNSYSDTITDHGIVKISKIEIWWGCLSKNTNILMDDNTIKNVTEIKIGDKIKTLDGQVEVQDIITGQEETMLFIRTRNGKEITVTSTHPMITARGMVPARLVSAEDQLVAESGLEYIDQIYPTQYNNVVYSLKLSKQSIIYTNGICTGDFDSQNEIFSSNKSPVFSDEVNELSDQLSELLNHLNNLSK